MFGKKKGQPATINTLVGADTQVHGDVEFRGGFLVDGHIKGNVTADGDPSATLSISERGYVEGAVSVPNVVLNGTVKGDVHATQRVELGNKARVIGNVQYNLIEMAIGAEVNGKLIHESDAQSGAPRSAPAGARAEAGEPAQGSEVLAVRPVNAVGE